MRTLARECVFKLLFEYGYYLQKNEETLEDFCLDQRLDSSDLDYLRDTYDACCKHYNEAEEFFKKGLKDTDPNRVFYIDKTVIMLAIIEAKFMQLPIKLAINEALELAKKFSATTSVVFINGFLKQLFE